MCAAKYERVQSEPTHNEENIDEIYVEDTKVHIVNNNQNMPLRFGILYRTIITLILILNYFILSIGLTFYQRKLVSKEINFPLFIVLSHFCIKFCLALLIRLCYQWKTGKARILLDFHTWVTKISPPGIAGGIDIGFSNWGLELVNISLYTMTKSTTIIFILIFAIVLKLEKKSWSLVIIVLMIATGLVLVTYKSTSFDALGFTFLLFASLSSGIRWTFSQLVMQKVKLGLHNPIDMVFHMQPWMILIVLPSAFICEGSRLFPLLGLTSTVTISRIMEIILKISGGALIAFALEISEFLLICRTSSLTVSITGIFKEICQIILAVLINHDQLSLINVCGLLLCVGGIMFHAYHKFSEYNLNEGTNFDDNESNVSYTKTCKDASINFESRQRMPLLDAEHFTETDSDDSQNNHQNSSEVIFDVLKRRDPTQ